MARPDIRLNLPKPSLTPQAAPVDTYYQPKVPKTAGMITNDWLQAAGALKALSPSITGFVQDIEKQKRELVPEKAALAAEGYTGEYKDLADMPTMSNEQVAVFLKDNADKFDADLTYGSRPDFILQFKNFMGRRAVKDSMRVTGSDGSLMSYRAAAYSWMDELGTPGFDVSKKLAELREEFLAGVDPEAGQAWINGVISAVAPIDREVGNVAASKQDANRRAEDVHIRTEEVLEVLDFYDHRLAADVPEGFEKFGSVAGESPAEHRARYERNKKRLAWHWGKQKDAEGALKILYAGPAEVGGTKRNEIFKTAIERKTEQILRDGGDYEDVEEFIEWAGKLELQDGGKPMASDNHWIGALEDIKDSAYRRAQRTDDGDLTIPGTVYSLKGELRNMLRDSGLQGEEELLEYLHSNGAVKMIGEALRSQGHASRVEGNTETIIGDAVEEWVVGLQRKSSRLDSASQTLYEEIAAEIESSGPTDTVEAKIREHMNELGGAVEGSKYLELLDRSKTLRAEGYSDVDHRQSLEALDQAIITDQALKRLPAAEQEAMLRFRQAARSEFTDGMYSRTDPNEKRSYLRTGWQQIAAKTKAETDYEKALQGSYDRQPELLVHNNKLLMADVDRSLAARIPDFDLVDDGLGLGGQTRVHNPRAVDLRRDAKAQILQFLETRVADELKIHGDIADPFKRNQKINTALINGDPTTGAPSLTQIIQRQFDLTPAPGVEQTVVAQEQAQQSLIQTEQKALTASNASAVALGGGTNGVGGHTAVGIEAERLAMTFKQDAKLGATDEYNAAIREAFGAPSPVDYEGLYPSVKADMDERLPSRNRTSIMITAHLLLGGEKPEPPKSFWFDDWFGAFTDVGDTVSDIGHEYSSLPPKALIEKQKFGLTSRGLGFKEIELGQTREGLALSTLWGSAWNRNLPLEEMHIGPRDPKAFQAAVEEWESSPKTSQYWKAMERLGYSPGATMDNVPSSEKLGRKPTQGEFLMKRLMENYALMYSALGPEGMARIDRPYSSIKRMQPGFSPLSRGTQSERESASRIHSIDIQETLRREQEWLDK